MTLAEAKQAIEAVEDRLKDTLFCEVLRVERDGRRMTVAITEGLRKSCRKGKVWKSRPFLATFKNVTYGFDEAHAHSPGGSDGIFVLTRTYSPKNEMMKKIFDQFLDKKGSDAAAIAERLGVKLDELIPVRIVAHSVRLLGVLRRGETEDYLVLVDYDDTK